MTGPFTGAQLQSPTRLCEDTFPGVQGEGLDSSGGYSYCVGAGRGILSPITDHRQDRDLGTGTVELGCLLGSGQGRPLTDLCPGGSFSCSASCRLCGGDGRTASTEAVVTTECRVGMALTPGLAGQLGGRGHPLLSWGTSLALCPVQLGSQRCLCLTIQVRMGLEREQLLS